MTETNSLSQYLPSHESNTSPSRCSREDSPSVEQASYSPSTSHWIRSYRSDASIALIGIRGAGLSTLAVIAAGCLNFKILDADHQFYQATALSRAKYRSEYGHAQYRQAETVLLHSMLTKNPSNTIIVCGPGAVEPSGRTSLSKFASDHPVIHVTRDAQGIQSYLRVWDTVTVSTIQKASAPVLRLISNFEYHNSTRVVNVSEQTSHDPLALKQVEKDFVHFLYSITARHRVSLRPLDSPRLTLSENQRLTYNLIIPLPVPDTYWIGMREEDILANAVELLIPLSAIGLDRAGFDGLAADYITQQYCAAKSSTHLPVILSFQVIDQHSDSSDQAKDCYCNALYHCLRLAPDYLCIDLMQDPIMIQRLMAVRGHTKIIAECVESRNHRDWSSPIWSERVTLAETIGVDALRLTQKATTMADNFAVRHFVDRMNSSTGRKITVIAYNTGHLGRMSQYCGTCMNPVADHRLQDHSAWGSYASMLTMQQSHSALYTSYILDALNFGIYGNDIAQSLSPAMHNAAFQKSGMPHVYKLFQYSTLEELRKLISHSRLGGLSVTAPFKSQVLSLVDEMSHEASIIGAVNTLVPLRSDKSLAFSERNRSGPSLALYGDNTDWIGITNCVMNNLSPINAIKRKTTALVVGAGGMARAATYALARLGVRRIFIHNRSLERAEALVEHFTSCGVLHRADMTRGSALETDADCQGNSSAISILTEKTDYWPEDVNSPTIVVSCIATKNLDGQCSVDTSLPPLWLASLTGGVAVELSYAPPITPLLNQVRSLQHRGWVAVDGLQMLPEQGQPQFELFTSHRAPIKSMRDAVLRAHERNTDVTPRAARAVRTEET
ncbi:hypothetical protein C7974DRAFT_44446 [Boeremia exigua]|uniref:uncharacterized protein n=1 Tax=Boeremia exigua TaxID=749465 RepID=UPI001E8E80A4|nr:uncharacterized protein C7974DRAFT_44446 [Boeremia exigua]KAH6616412.1 hypothetical protein C7974DRAFT_44446 [Boeremia exigua]